MKVLRRRCDVFNWLFSNQRIVTTVSNTTNQFSPFKFQGLLSIVISPSGALSHLSKSVHKKTGFIDLHRLHGNRHPGFCTTQVTGGEGYHLQESFTAYLLPSKAERFYYAPQ